MWIILILIFQFNNGRSSHLLGAEIFYKGYILLLVYNFGIIMTYKIWDKSNLIQIIWHVDTSHFYLPICLTLLLMSQPPPEKFRITSPIFEPFLSSLHVVSKVGPEICQDGHLLSAPNSGILFWGPQIFSSPIVVRSKKKNNS